MLMHVIGCLLVAEEASPCPDPEAPRSKEAQDSSRQGAVKQGKRLNGQARRDECRAGIAASERRRALADGRGVERQIKGDVAINRQPAVPLGPELVITRDAHDDLTFFMSGCSVKSIPSVSSRGRLPEGEREPELLASEALRASCCS